MRIVADKKLLAAGGSDTCIVRIPKGHKLIRVETYVVTGAGTSYGDTATATLDMVFCSPIDNLNDALHLITQEPLFGRGVVAWDGEILADEQDISVAAQFVNVSAGGQIELTCGYEVL